MRDHGGWGPVPGRLAGDQRAGFPAPPSRSGEDRPSHRAFGALPLGSEGCNVLPSLMFWGWQPQEGVGPGDPCPAARPCLSAIRLSLDCALCEVLS